MVYYGVIWSYCRLVFTCFPLSSFCFLSCFHAFPVTVSVGFLSAFVSFCWSVFFSYLVFPPAAFTFCQVSTFRLQVFFSSGGFVFPSGFAFWNEAKTKAKTRQNSRQAAWHEPGQELANLLPHPATTATTTIATAGHSCAFAAGICLTSTNKAPTAPASPRLLLLQLLLMLMLLVLVLVLVLVAAAVTCCDCCHCCRCCHCCHLLLPLLLLLLLLLPLLLLLHCYCYCSCYCPAPAACASTVASSSTFVASTSHSTNPGTSWHGFYNFCHCCCH